MGLIKITATDAKVTFCTTEAIADLVEVDYMRRGFEGIELDVREGDTYHLDFGGFLVDSMAAVRVGRLSFWPHQADGVLAMLRSVEDRGGYVKLHGKCSCLCLSVEEAATIREAVTARMAEFLDTANKQWAKWEAATVKGRRK